MGCLYSLESPSGKKYIGISSKTLEDRWAKHVEHALGKRTNGAIYAALRKYGPENFKKETLVVADFEYLKGLEVRAIAAYGTYYPNGYNLTEGGEGTTGKRTPEQIAKHTAAQRRRYQKPEERKKAGEQFIKWREANPEAYLAAQEKHRVAMSARKKAKLIDPDKRTHSERTRDAMKRPEVREKVLAVARARAADPAWREKMSAIKKGQRAGIPHTEEWKAAQLSGIKAAWADPIKKAARIEKNRIARKAKK